MIISSIKQDSCLGRVNGLAVVVQVGIIVSGGPGHAVGVGLGNLTGPVAQGLDSQGDLRTSSAQLQAGTNGLVHEAGGGAANGDLVASSGINHNGSLGILQSGVLIVGQHQGLAVLNILASDGDSGLSGGMSDRNLICHDKGKVQLSTINYDGTYVIHELRQ